MTPARTPPAQQPKEYIIALNDAQVENFKIICSLSGIPFDQMFRPHPAATTTAWAIKAPENLGGKIDPVCIRASRQDAIESTGGNWKWASEQGYRCVRVQVQEIPHD